MRIKCKTEPEHYHEYPDNWAFGGPDGTDPAADPRWETQVYQYLNSHLEVVHSSVVPRCDDAALDYFTQIAAWGLKPVYIQKNGELMNWQYIEDQDLVLPL